MKPVVTVIAESESANLGDRAIVQAISQYLSEYSKVRLFSLSNSKLTSASKNYSNKKFFHIRDIIKKCGRIAPVTLRSRVRWYLLGERRRYQRLVENQVVGSSVILIGGGQLIKNNAALFCDRLAVIARVAAHQNVPYSLFGVGVDRKMSFLTWRIVKNTIINAKTVFVRDLQSKNRILTQYPCGVACKIIPDLAFALRSEKAAYLSRDTEYAINIMSVPPMIEALPKSIKLSAADIRDMWYSVILLLAERGAAPVIFTTGSPEDLREAQDMQIRLRAKAGISVELIHPASVEELQSLLSQFQNVLASRMHAGILAYILGCNTLCLNWDDKVKGVWTTVSQESRVVEIESLTGPEGAECLLQKFANSYVPTVENIFEVSRMVRARLKAELIDRI